MALERDYAFGYNALEHLNRDLRNAEYSIEYELAKKGVLLRLFRDANLFLTVIAKIKNSSTDYEPMNLWQYNDEEVIWKNWEIPIVSTSQSGLDSLATIIIPYITYTVLYETGSENDIDFYDSQYNLKQTSHFEVKDETLYLKASVYLKKYFDSNSLIVPNAKILVDFKNPYQVSR